MIELGTAWTDVQGALHEKGIYGYKLGPTCQLTQAWSTPLSSGSYFEHMAAAGGWYNLVPLHRYRTAAAESICCAAQSLIHSAISTVNYGAKMVYIKT